MNTEDKQHPKHGKTCKCCGQCAKLKTKHKEMESRPTKEKEIRHHLYSDDCIVDYWDY